MGKEENYRRAARERTKKYGREHFVRMANISNEKKFRGMSKEERSEFMKRVRRGEKWKV